jgi:hypothetical protein
MVVMRGPPSVRRRLLLRRSGRAQLSELVPEPAPRISCQLRIPDPRTGLITQEPRMVVRHPERPRRVGKTIKLGIDPGQLFEIQLATLTT